MSKQNESGGGKGRTGKSTAPPGARTNGSSAKTTEAVEQARDFMRFYFGDNLEGAWMACFYGDPNAGGDWTGMPAEQLLDSLPNLISSYDGRLPNLYWSPSRYANARRSNDNFIEAVALVVDDVGPQADVDTAKRRYEAALQAFRDGPLARWKALPLAQRGAKPRPPKYSGVKIAREKMLERLGLPTTALETSKSNCQWFYKFDRPCSNKNQLRALLLVIGSDARDLARVMRAPGGSNWKAGALVDGRPFLCRVIEADSSRAVFRIEDLLERIGAEVQPDEPRQHSSSGEEKLEFRALKEAGLLLGSAATSNPDTANSFWMTCPGFNGDEESGGWIGGDVGHSAGADQGRAKVWAHGGFRCFHDSCKDRDFNDLASWVERHPDCGPILDRLKTEQAKAAFPSLDGTPDEKDDIEAGDVTRRPPLELQPEHFVYLPGSSGGFIHRLTDTVYSAPNIDKRMRKVLVRGKGGKAKGIAPSVFVAKHYGIEGVTWVPGLPEIIRDCIYNEAGERKLKHAAVFNRYKPPIVDAKGDPKRAGPWLDLVKFDYPDDAERLFDIFAHVVQRPEIKINRILVLAGRQGVGKDSLLVPVLEAVGRWNTHDIKPSKLFEEFNPFARSVILCIAEARDLEHKRVEFYNALKEYAVSPPDVILVNEKHRAPFYSRKPRLIIETTNDPEDLYMPPEDRRHDVAMSERSKEDFAPDAWTTLHDWYEREGNAHVAAWLRQRDISRFKPKATPPQTDAWRRIVDNNQPEETGELDDALDMIGRPAAVTIARILRNPINFWLVDHKNRAVINRHFRNSGYVPVIRPGTKRALWIIGGRRQTIYARRDLSEAAKTAAALDLCEEEEARRKAEDDII